MTPNEPEVCTGHLRPSSGTSERRRARESSVQHREGRDAYGVSAPLGRWRVSRVRQQSVSPRERNFSRTRRRRHCQSSNSIPRLPAPRALGTSTRALAHGRLTERDVSRRPRLSSIDELLGRRTPRRRCSRSSSAARARPRVLRRWAPSSPRPSVHRRHRAEMEYDYDIFTIGTRFFAASATFTPGAPSPATRRAIAPRAPIRDVIRIRAPPRFFPSSPPPPLPLD